MLKITLVVLCANIFVASAAPRGKKKELDNKIIDQSQEGQWNVRADLEKFVILLLPNPGESAGAPALLDFLLRSVSPGKLGKGNHHKKHNKGEEIQETNHFIESKAAPYHVDISKSNLQINPINSEDTLVANSPTVTLVKTPADGASLVGKLKNIVRNSKAVIFTISSDDKNESNSMA